MGWYHDGWSSGHWVGAVVLMVLFWAGLALLVIALVRAFGPRAHTGPQSPGPAPGKQAEQLLAERFARGEIDEDEFVRRRDLLRGS